MQLWVKSSFSVILNGWTWFYRVYFWDAHTPDVLYNKDRINILGLHLFGFCFPFPRYIYWMLPIPFHFHGAPRGLSICCRDWPNMSLFPMGHSQSLGTWPDQRVGPWSGGRTAEEKGKVQREQLTFQSLSWVHTLCTSLSSAGTCNILNSCTRLATLDYTQTFAAGNTNMGLSAFGIFELFRLKLLFRFAFLAVPNGHHHRPLPAEQQYL